MAQKILIACKLPHGIKLVHPIDKSSVTIAGLKDSKIIGATYMTTPVDAEFWATWKSAYIGYAPLKNGSLFEASNADAAESKAKDLAKVKTGFEPLNPESMGVKKAS